MVIWGSVTCEKRSALGDHFLRRAKNLLPCEGDRDADHANGSLLRRVVDPRVRLFRLDADQNASIRALSADRSTHIMAFDFNGGVLLQVGDDLIPIPGPDISLSVERALNLVDRYAIAGDFRALRSIAAIVKPKRQQRRSAVSIPEATPPAWNQLPAV